MKTAICNLRLLLSMKPSVLVSLMCMLCLSSLTNAESIETKLPSGITALADYQVGKPSQTAILFLHGLHQTHHSQPLSSLASNLVTKGYTTLSPNLTLNVNKRAQTMACEAVHTQSMERGVEEIAYWINWLHKKGHQDVTLIGFSSTGNILALLYNTQNSHPAVQQTILVSLTPLLIDPNEKQTSPLSDHALTPAERNKLGKYTVGYCKKNFVAIPHIYQSYAKYDYLKILDLLKIEHANTALIYGSADYILPASWISQVQAVRPQSEISIIDKADHFFDGTFEFDLADKVEKILVSNSRQ